MSGAGKQPSAEQSSLLRQLPSVEQILESPEADGIIASYGRDLAVGSIRSAIADLRALILSEAAINGAELTPAAVANRAGMAASRTATPNLIPIVNATGVVLHTNLGRAVLAPEALEAVLRVSASYSNLEYDLDQGRRGSRHDHITGLIVALTGAEDALVVNNNAAAVLLALSAFAAGREVVVSRGQLIEIGGSFRIPDVLTASTARLVEVGTTNKTKLNDYEQAIGSETAMLLHVHSSNYKVVGFTAEVAIADLVELGYGRGLVVVDDLGSGALAELPALVDEPSVQESLAAGADLVTFSGDKLLGGPQAGIIVGKREHVRRLKAHPMARAMRVDKMTLAALQATLAIYLNPDEALERIPTLRMLSETVDSLRARAEDLAAELDAAIARAFTDANGSPASFTVEKASSKVGGGALPLLELDSYVCSVTPASVSVDELAARLRRTDPPVIGRIHKEALLLDARTILPGQNKAIAAAMAQALSSPPTQ